MLLPELSKRMTVVSDGRRKSPVAASVIPDEERQMTVRLHAMTRHASTLEKRQRTQANARHRVWSSADARQMRPRLANVAVPLGVTAAIVSEQWWVLVPLGVCAWWWAPRDSGWEWALAIGRGLVTTEWALVGAYALEAFPDKRAVVGAGWVVAAVLLAASAKLAR
jgi:hypothetical protein